MRPGTGSSPSQARAASASGPPMARSVPSTPSRLETLYCPMVAVDMEAVPPPASVTSNASPWSP